jgi:hypothetical protein
MLRDVGRDAGTHRARADDADFAHRHIRLSFALQHIDG